MPSIRTRLALLLSAVLLATGLTGCAGLFLYPDCDGMEGRVEQVRSLAILDAAPPGAATPKELAEDDAGCWEDSGEAWVHTGRLYAFSRERREVVDFYRTTAAADGWTYEGEPTVASVCFTKGDDGGTLMLTVTFMTAEELKEYYGHGTWPEFASGSGYELQVSTAVDGSDISCLD